MFIVSVYKKVFDINNSFLKLFLLFALRYLPMIENTIFAKSCLCL